MQLPDSGHDPVLLAEVMDRLNPRPGQTFVDCTIGRAGHASAIAERLGPSGTLIGLDADPRNLEFAKSRLVNAPCRVRLFHANFAELQDVLTEVEHADHVDGILADLGISHQPTLRRALWPVVRAGHAAGHAASIRESVESAADLVNQMREDDLANVLYELAQEHYSRRIARKIADARRISPITSTERLAELVRRPSRRGVEHPRTNRSRHPNVHGPSDDGEP